MMHLQLRRDDHQPDCTLGRLFVDGVFECFTCEDVEREEKVHGQTAIPRGTYEVIVSFSNRFRRELPLLLNVPGFEGIRIHPGNTAADTEGCILPGRHRTAAGVTDSRLAFASLFLKVRRAIDQGERVTIEVRAP